MELQKAEVLARELMDGNRLKRWKFRWQKKTGFKASGFGYCWGWKKTITLHPQLVLMNNEERVKTTLLHEIAHALAYKAGYRGHHGSSWAVEAIALGIEPRRCYEPGVDVITFPQMMHWFYSSYKELRIAAAEIVIWVRQYQNVGQFLLQEKSPRVEA